MQQHLCLIVIALADCLLQILEISLYHLSIRINGKVSSSKWEEVIAFGVIVSDDSSLPFFLWLLQLRVSSVSILMADKVNEVRMSNSGIANCVCESTARLRDFLNL